MQPSFWGPVSAFAVIAATLHVVGYGFYLRSVLRQKIDPNPISWLMFAYGTTLLVVLESAAGASWQELALPMICAAASVTVAAICWSRRTLRWPSNRIDLYSFAADVAITIAYIACWAIARLGVLSQTQMAVAVLTFLILWNAAVVTSFTPIVVSTWRDPARESWVPWTIWTVAYTTLTVVTFMQQETQGNHILYLYPLSNALIHGLVAILALNLLVVTKLSRRSTAHSLPQLSSGVSNPPLDFLYVAETKHTGRGVFTSRPFRKGDHVCNVTGIIHKYMCRTREDSLRYPNWFQLGDDVWCDPDHPFDYLNHSCDPNCAVVNRSIIALRNIRPGDELTSDYSLIDSDEHWQMECSCRTPNCRGVIRPIQFLPREVYAGYEPYIGTYFRRVYEAINGTVKQSTAM